MIRYAKVEDSNILGEIHSEAAKAGFSGIIPDYVLKNTFSVEKRTSRFISEINIGSPRTVIAFKEHEPAGFISFGECRYGKKDDSRIELWRVYICPKFWGSGIAKELIEWTMDEILKEGLKAIELWVLEENIRARKFYEKMGFKYDETFQILEMGRGLKELHYIKI